MFIKPEEIKAFRRSKKWTQRQVAESRSVDVRTVKRWEKNGLEFYSLRGSWWGELQRWLSDERERAEKIAKGDISTGSRRNVTTKGSRRVTSRSRNVTSTNVTT